MTAPLRDPNNLIAIIYDWAAANAARQHRGHFHQFHSVFGRPCNDLSKAFAELVVRTVVWKSQCDDVLICTLRRCRVE
ncbi:hypothetical protein CWO90_14010 [Bradyrhizobium sp. Leo121]|nr:hypothetical protein CWO90_14010 [Bradyrhizobium sp. Leo121]